VELHLVVPCHLENRRPVPCRIALPRSHGLRALTGDDVSRGARQHQRQQGPVRPRPSFPLRRTGNHEDPSAKCQSPILKMIIVVNTLAAEIFHPGRVPDRIPKKRIATMNCSTEVFSKKHGSQLCWALSLMTTVSLLAGCGTDDPEPAPR